MPVILGIVVEFKYDTGERKRFASIQLWHTTKGFLDTALNEANDV